MLSINLIPFVSLFALPLFLPMSLRAQEPSKGVPVSFQDVTPKRRPVAKRVCFSEPIRKQPVMLEKVGRVDVAATIKAVQSLGLKAYAFPLGYHPTDWRDFKSLLAEAEKSGLEIWLKLNLPGSGHNSLPYYVDYGKWAQECVRLSKKHKNLTTLLFDNPTSPRNMKFVRGFRYEKWRKILNEGGLSMAGICYSVIERSAQEFAEAMDIWIVAFCSVRTLQNLSGLAEGARKMLPKSTRVMTGIYAAATPWDDRPPAIGFVGSAMHLVRHRSDGVLLMNVALGPKMIVKEEILELLRQRR